ncbi:MAG: RNA polymerase sigma factor [Thermoanaerobaculia bacterium]
MTEFLGGEEAAFRALYDEHAPSLYAFLLRLLGRWRSEANDALQDVWLRAARDLGRFRWQSSFRTWLFGIAVNRCREILRLTPNFDEELGEIDVAAPAVSTDERIDLERAVARLPLRYREVVVLHDIYQHTHAEIAAMLGIEEGTSKSNLSRAHAQLRRFIGGHDD